MVGAFCTVGPRAVVCGNVTAGDGVVIRAGATINQGIRIASGVVVGSGAVVVDDIELAEGFVVGNPARSLTIMREWADRL